MIYGIFVFYLYIVRFCIFFLVQFPLCFSSFHFVLCPIFFPFVFLFSFVGKTMKINLHNAHICKSVHFSIAISVQCKWKEEEEKKQNFIETLPCVYVFVTSSIPLINQLMCITILFCFPVQQFKCDQSFCSIFSPSLLFISHKQNIEYC